MVFSIAPTTYYCFHLSHLGVDAQITTDKYPATTIANNPRAKRGNELSNSTGEVPNELSIFMQHVGDQALATPSPTQIRFAISMRTIGPFITRGNLKKYISKMFTPTGLLAREIACMQRFWIELRSFFDPRKATLQKHSSRREILKLPHGFYQEVEDRIGCCRNDRC